MGLACNARVLGNASHLSGGRRSRLTLLLFDVQRRPARRRCMCAFMCDGKEIEVGGPLRWRRRISHILSWWGGAHNQSERNHHPPSPAAALVRYHFRLAAATVLMPCPCLHCTFTSLHLLSPSPPFRIWPFNDGNNINALLATESLYEQKATKHAALVLLVTSTPTHPSTHPHTNKQTSKEHQHERRKDLLTPLSAPPSCVHPSTFRNTTHTHAHKEERTPSNHNVVANPSPQALGTKRREVEEKQQPVHHPHHYHRHCS